MSGRETTGGRTSLIDRLRQPIGSGARPHPHPHPNVRNGVGSVPHVSLLPAEIRDAGTSARRRHRLVALVAAVAVCSAAGIAGAGAVNDASAARLRAASTQTAVLNGQIAKFSDVRALQTRIALGQAAVTVGSSTIIDWAQQISAIEGDLPAGYTVTSISASGATPLQDYAQGVTPLEPRRAATITLTMTTGTVGHEFSVYLRLLRSIPAYADANASYSTTEGVTTVVLTVHLTEKAITATHPAVAPADDTETP